MTASTAAASGRAASILSSRAGGRRTFVDRFMRTLAMIAAFSCIVPLAAVLAYVTIQGIAALNLDLLTKPPRAQGIGGGALPAILGTIQMVGLASLLAIPIGLLAGVYIHEYASPRTSRGIRFAADVLVGVPSILIGIFIYTILVLPFKQYNAFAGAVALAVIMIPVIMRTTEEIMKLVPDNLREASLALGVLRWRTTLSIMVRTALPGVLTGIMLAVARAAGETAPLLFTALGSRLVNVGDWTKPMDALPLFIYTNARAPFERQNQQAWGAAFLLLLLVLTINVLVRFRSTQRRTK